MKQVLFSAFLMVAGGVLSDTVVAYWDFGPDSSGYTENVAIDHANGTPSLTGMSDGTGYDSNGQPGVAFTDAAGTNHVAGQALAWGSGVNDGNQEWVLSIDLTGYHDLSIRWDFRSTVTYGPTNAVLEYKVGAGSWAAIETLSFPRDATYHAYEKDLSPITAINNQASVQFRLSGFSGGSGSGTYRTDNLQLSAIPEPAVMGFVGLVGLAFLATRRFLEK